MPFEVQPYEWLQEQSASIISTCLDDSENLYSFKAPKGYKILVMGSEAHGISQSILDISNFKIHIPISNQIESLNVAIAAGIMIFHLQNAG
jgi:TrmH family RNA methyltransferase